MNTIIERIKDEPALVTGLVTALVAFAVAFGVDLNEAQQAAIFGLAIAIMSFVTRAQVTPNRKVK